MKKKSLILALAVSCISITASAQKSAIATAKEEYDKYTAMKAQPKLAEPAMKAAQEAIDKAVVHEKTKEDVNAWTYKALIYSELAYDKKTDDLANQAAEAIKKATALDVKGENKDKLKNANTLLYYYQVQKGKGHFDNKDYANAYNEFNKALVYNPGDTTANYASGLAAMYSKDYPKAIERYNELLKTNYSQLESIYSNLSIMYAAQKDTASAIRILSEGASKFPNSTDLATREIEFNLMSGKQKQVIDKISSQVEKNPTNRLYPFYLGIAYASAGDTKKAEEAYKKAIAVDPNYADAYVNLGGLIMNNGIDIYNKANKLPTSKVTEYNALKKQSAAEFDRALPYLEKSAQLNPNSELALRNLRTYYSIKNNTAKVAEIDAKIKALK
ncbi:tetratricopeptide repeat protein [Desertivirga brevis]|uniref:tetratricopeptide repeat protein n=1 Tax=Desertivirga brevis TaxID=2810310 RepID=UPI001A9665A0|nr:tetratricopeptide repeat protein [Pedobacter sp. SYSU D00873]